MALPPRPDSSGSPPTRSRSSAMEPLGPSVVGQHVRDARTASAGIPGTTSVECATRRDAPAASRKEASSRSPRIWQRTHRPLGTAPEGCSRRDTVSVVPRTLSTVTGRAPPTSDRSRFRRRRAAQGLQHPTADWPMPQLVGELNGPVPPATDEQRARVPVQAEEHSVVRLRDVAWRHESERVVRMQPAEPRVRRLQQLVRSHRIGERR